MIDKAMITVYCVVKCPCHAKTSFVNGKAAVVLQGAECRLRISHWSECASVATAATSREARTCWVMLSGSRKNPFIR